MVDKKLGGWYIINASKKGDKSRIFSKKWDYSIIILIPLLKSSNSIKRGYLKTSYEKQLHYFNSFVFSKMSVLYTIFSTSKKLHVLPNTSKEIVFFFWCSEVLQRASKYTVTVFWGLISSASKIFLILSIKSF